VNGRPTSALNRGVMYKLIISGRTRLPIPARNGSPERSWRLWEPCHLCGNRQGAEPPPVDREVRNLTELQEFQFRKQVLPAYSFDLLAAFGAGAYRA
jgi:hypothetical protein